MALSLGCGARSTLDDEVSVTSAGSSVPGGSSSSGGGSACGAGSGRVMASLTLDAPDATHEPESRPLLAWTGSELLVAWTRWTDGGYELRLAAVRIGDGALSVDADDASPIGNSTNPYQSSIAWDGSALARFWAQDDGSILMQRFSSAVVPLGAPTTVVPAGGQQTSLGPAFAIAGGYLLTWDSQQSSEDWLIYGARISFADATLAGPNTIAEQKVYPSDPMLASAGGDVFVAWGTDTSPLLDDAATHLARLDPGSAAVSGQTTVDSVGNRELAAFVAEPDRLDLAVWSVDDKKMTVLSRPLGGTLFAARTTLAAVDWWPRLVEDGCGLVALVPSDDAPPESCCATGLALQRLGEHGERGAPLALPVAGLRIEDWSLIAVDGGLIAAWVEGVGGGGSPDRRLQVAYAAIP